MTKSRDSVKNFNVVDLFSGIGGFHQALSFFGGKTVLASDIDKFAIETYKKNYGMNSELSVEQINDEKILKLPNKIHVITAGFPCQSFSNAGKKMGFEDEKRGQLIYSVAKIIKKTEKHKKKPKILLLENVKHLINHNEGKTFKKILFIFRNLNYVTIDQPIIISPHQIGIPQHRPRVIIPFVLNENKDKTLKKRIEKKLNEIMIKKNNFLEPIKNYLEQTVDKSSIIKDKNLLKVFKAGEEFVKKIIRPTGRTLPVIGIDELKQTYSLEGLSEGKKKYILDMRLIYRKNKNFINSGMKKWEVHKWTKRNKKLEGQAGIDNFEFKNAFIQLRQSGIRCRKKDMFPALVAMVQIPILYDKELKAYRHLTPREVGNIQSFSKEFKINSNTFQSYKQFGNAVNVKVIKYVFNKIKCFL